MKKLAFVLLLLASISVLAACGGEDSTLRDSNGINYDEDGDTNNDVNDDNNDVNDDNDDADDLREFTITELSNYDGRDGNEAFIAVDGYVYDVSNSSQWPNGLHRNQHQAGQDLSVVINSSPHGRSVLDNIPRIGRLVD